MLQTQHSQHRRANSDNRLRLLIAGSNISSTTVPGQSQSRARVERVEFQQRAPRPNPHPQLIQSHNFASASALQQQQQRAQALSFVHQIPGAVCIPGLNQFLRDGGRWTTTDDLVAVIERADRLQRALGGLLMRERRLL